MFCFRLYKNLIMALTNKPVFKDKRTKEKIDLHLRDINDEITEKDIENVQTDVTGMEAEDVEAKQEADHILEKKKHDDKSREDNNNSNSVQTPWNMLD